jgi:hypothetical protein
MPLCDICQSIDTRRLLETFHTWKDVLVSYHLPQLKQTVFCMKYGQRHHDSFTTLRSAAEAGCDFCGMIWAHHGDRRLYKLKGHADCTCGQYLGQVHLIIVQDEYSNFPKLTIIVMPLNDVNGSGGYKAAEFEMCLMKGMA